jgi:hypothetical protein
MGDNDRMRKGVTTRDTRLSVRVPTALKAAIEREAERDQRTVADVVIIALEAAFLRRSRSSSRKGGK